MSERQTIIKEIFDLSDTVREGLQHIEKRLGEGHFEDTAYLFEDIKEAFVSIAQAIEPLFVKEKLLEKLTEKMSVALEEMNNSYENGKLDQARMNLQFVLFPAYNSWQSELQKCLNNIIES